jgi:pyruvate/2-oxoglutarate dehydrogenase complex dihydrolipoamide acyltransferase (E2) component
MPHEVIMPALGMAQDTGVLVAWLKAPGDPVKAGDALMEVETDKATMEEEAAHDGYLTDVQATEGEAVPAARFISKGFARGTAPDNLVVLPFGQRREAPLPPLAATEAVACPACGDFSLQQRGAGWICDTCGAAPSMQG